MKEKYLPESYVVELCKFYTNYQKRCSPEQIKQRIAEDLELNIVDGITVGKEKPWSDQNDEK